MSGNQKINQRTIDLFIYTFITLAVSTTTVLIHEQVRHKKKDNWNVFVHGWIVLIFIISLVMNRTGDKIGMTSSKMSIPAVLSHRSVRSCAIAIMIAICNYIVQFCINLMSNITIFYRDDGIFNCERYDYFHGIQLYCEIGFDLKCDIFDTIAIKTLKLIQTITTFNRRHSNSS